MLVPGTWSWTDAIGVGVVAVILLFLPGLVVALLARTRVSLALALAPALSTGIVAVGGVVFGSMRRPWTLLALVVTVAAAWLLALAGRVAVNVIRRRLRAIPAGESAIERPHPPPPESTPVGSHWLESRAAQATATAAGMAFAFIFFGSLFVRTSGSPEAFPQHPDTIFHLGVAQWMFENKDISFFHSQGFSTGLEAGGYPIGFHDMTATISLITGAPVVVSTSAFVLVTAGIAWPLGMAVLARTMFGKAPQVGAAGAAVSVLFTAFPYMPITFGVLWPNFYGQAIMPGVLAATSIFLRVLRPGERTGRTLGAGLIGLLALPGLALAHYNAFISFALFAAVMTLIETTRFAAKTPRKWPRWLPLLTTLALLALAALASRHVAPAGMLSTGAPGPELTVPESREDTFQFAPRGTQTQPVLALLVLAGAVLISWRRRVALWAVVSGAVMMALFYINIAIDAPWSRQLTWPWYNNAVRIAAIETLPIALVATAGVVMAGNLLARWSAHRKPAATVLSLALLVSVIAWTGGYRATKYNWVSDLFNPRASHSWASPSELRALRSLERFVPEGTRVAASPWNGGSYMYIVSGQRMLWPTEKTNNDPDRQLLGRSLDRIGTDKSVCQAAERLHVTYALTGGRAFNWAKKWQRDEYAGVNAVGSSPAWTKVSTEGPYTLYRLTSCAA